MLTLTTPKMDLWDEQGEEYVYVDSHTLSFEHSLVAISKWHKPFFSNAEKTKEETIDYIKCMCLTKNVDDIIFYCLSEDNQRAITEYISNPMTATTINKKKGSSSREIITSEIVYYWMIALGIPWECQKWHINKLLTLIEVCNIKNDPGKKMSNREILSRNAELNRARRQALGSKG